MNSNFTINFLEKTRIGIGIIPIPWNQTQVPTIGIGIAILRN